LAADAIKEGKVKIGPQTVKASAQVGVGEIVEVRKNGFNFRYRVEKLLKTRVSAVLAQEAITNITTEEELNKYNVWFTNKMASRDRGTGRPTKKERRDLDGFQGPPGFEWLDDEDDLDDDDSDDTDDDA
jgi:ribosome-associated heat shock protein Hsp15